MGKFIFKKFLTIYEKIVKFVLKFSYVSSLQTKNKRFSETKTAKNHNFICDSFVICYKIVKIN